MSKSTTTSRHNWLTRVATLSIIFVGLNTVPALVRQSASTQPYKAIVTESDRAEAARAGLSDSDLELVATLHDHGVVTGLAEDCGDDPGTAGFYLGAQEVLVLCVNGEHGPGGISDTLRHEALHAAQDCKAGQDNATFKPLTGMTRLPDDDLAAALREHYDEADWLIEYEAWAGAADLTNDQVATIVSRVCPAI